MKKNLYFALLTCMVSLASWALEPVDGVYQLATAEDMAEFAALIDEGTQEVKAVLTADIDLCEQPTLMIGNNSAAPFTGEFDGQGHTIKLALNVENTGDYSGSLFHFVKDATFKNLHLTGSVTTCGKHPASLVCKADGTVLLEKVTSDCDIFTNGNDACMGGLVGIAGENGDNAPATDLTFIDCAFTGSITHTGDDPGQNHGGNFVGWKGNRNTTVTVGRSFAAPKSITMSPNFSTFVRFWGGNDNGQINVSDSYYVNDITDYAAFQGTEATPDQFAGGEVCYNLNGRQTEGQAWFQTIGEDSYPTLDATHKTVYANGTLRCDGAPADVEYSNTYSDSPVAPPHTFVDGICQVCGQADLEFVKYDEDGFALIGTTDEMVWFANMVNKQNATLNARLTADIDMGPVEDFVMIGTGSQPYCGTFDGQDHIISNLRLEKTDVERFIGFFACVAGGANISHLILDNSCSITTSGYRVGMIGASFGKGDVYISYCGNEGNVTSTSPFESTAAGIFGCNQDCLSDVHIDHCYSTGVITGMNQSAQIAAWLNYFGNSEMTNCWSIAEVTGYDNEGSAMARHGGMKFQNNYSTYSQGIQFTPEELQSGELTFRMNGSALSANPVWYQTIGEDDYPTWNDGHGLVFKAGDDLFDSMQNDGDFGQKRATLLDYEKLFTEDIVATQALVDDYLAYLEELGELGFDDFLNAYSAVSSLKSGISESAQAYAAYMSKIEEINAYLAENESLSGTYLDFLKDYLEGEEKPGTYPNGTYYYIIENRLLTTEEIKAETEYAELLRRQAVEGGYVKDSDISNLLVNAEFANWYEGWEQTFNGGGHNSDVIEGRHISEAWNGTFDVHQTVSGLKPGIYEIQMQASYRPAFQPTSTNLSGMIYMNDQNVYIISSVEDMMPAENAVDRENCYLNMDDGLHDMIIEDAEGNAIGYVPRGTTGAYYAYKAGRYENRLVCLVGEDGQLTVGIKDPGTGAPEDETAWAEMKLIYRGTLEEATEAIDETLQHMTARAQTLLDYVCDVNFTLYPNFGNELRDGLKAAIDAAATAATGEEKYAVVNNFSELFRQVYTAKKAYIAYDKTANQYIDELADMLDAGYDFGEEGITPYVLMTYDIQDKLLAGEYTTEEALAQAELKALPYYTTVFGSTPELADGVYQIADYSQMVWLRKQINLGNTDLKVALVNDIDLSEYSSFMLSEEKAQSFTGVFDGQGHTIKLAIQTDRTGDFSGALFCFAMNATFKNLHLTGSVTTNGKHPASLVSCLYGQGESTLTNITSDCDIFTAANDACMAGLVGHAGDVWNGGVGANITFTNCAFTGNITHTGDANAQNHGGSFIGWKGCNDVTITINNSYAAPKSVNSPRFGTYVRYLEGMDNGQIFANNSYFQGGVVDYWAKQGEEKTADEFADGSVCYLLNGDQSEIAWYQKIGEDSYPVLDASHGKVIKNEDGTYSTVTGVEQIGDGQLMIDNATIYDLQGRKVQDKNLKNGLYIIGGRKVLVK